MSAARLAVEADVSPTTVSKIENGRGATPKLLAKVSEALEWPSDTLLLVSRGSTPPPTPAVATHRTTAERLHEVESELGELRAELDSQRQLLDTLLERTRPG